MSKEPKQDRTYRTAMFRVYCYKKSKPGKEEGTIAMTDERHRLVKSLPEEHFDSFDEIPNLIRRRLAGLKDYEGPSPQ